PEGRQQVDRIVMCVELLSNELECRDGARAGIDESLPNAYERLFHRLRLCARDFVHHHRRKGMRSPAVIARLLRTTPAPSPSRSYPTDHTPSTDGDTSPEPCSPAETDD